MKKKPVIIGIAVAGALAVALAATFLYERSKVALLIDDEARWDEIDMQPPLAGGYSERREPSDEEMAMFRAVTGSSDMVFTPLSVSTQVVAGTNYKFWCRYQDKEDSGHCWVVVFKPLPGRGDPQLTSIEKE